MLKFNRLFFYAQVSMIFFLITFVMPLSANAIPAFPGCAGGGCPDNLGGRGGTVIHVTNTNNSGTGSLRAAIEASGPRIVVFDVGGTIILSSNIYLRDPYITIAGQTAPGDGIQTNNHYILIQTHDVIIRGMRMRFNQNSGSQAGIEFTYNGGERAYDVAIDHNSFQYAAEETIAFWAGSSGPAIHDVTISWNIIADPLYIRDPGGYGLLTNQYVTNLTMHHNLFANCRTRTPRVHEQNPQSEFINNVVYNAGNQAARFGTGPYFVKNVYVEGPGSYSPSPSKFLVVSTGDSGCCTAGTFYVEGNIGPGRPADTGDEWGMVSGSASYQDPPPFTQWTLSGVTEDPVADVLSVVSAGVGATAPSRDSLDQRAVDDVNSGSTGENTMTTPGQRSCSGCTNGIPNLASGSTPIDTDGDGMPDSWETAHGLNSNSASDQNTDRDGDGWTNIEEYINSLLPAVAVSSPPPTPNLFPLPPSSLTIE